MDYKVLLEIWTSNVQRRLHITWNGPRTVKSSVNSPQNQNRDNQPHKMPKEFSQTRSRSVKKIAGCDIFMNSVQNQRRNNQPLKMPMEFLRRRPRSMKNHGP